MSIFGSFFRAVLPLAILTGGVIAYQYLSVEPESVKSPAAPQQTLKTRVTTLKSGDYQVLVKTQGILQAHHQVTLNAQIGGEVARICHCFEVGAYFEAGEVLVELDPRDYAIAVAVAQAKVAGAKANLELAEKNYERIRQLSGQGAISTAETDQSDANRRLMAAELDSAVSQLEKANRDLDRTKIKAPFDGRVRQRTVGLGQSVNPGSPLGVIFATDYAEVRLPIAAKDMQYLELPELEGDVGLEVELRDSLATEPKHFRKGRIVRTEGALDENSLDLFVIARVEDPFGLKSGELPLRIGQPVVASIAGKVLVDVLPIPRGAVRQLDQITLVDSSQFILRTKKVVPIWSDQEYVIVRDSSIHDGALLATTQLVYVPDGAKVEIIDDSIGSLDTREAGESPNGGEVQEEQVAKAHEQE